MLVANSTSCKVASVRNAKRTSLSESVFLSHITPAIAHFKAPECPCLFSGASPSGSCVHAIHSSLQMVSLGISELLEGLGGVRTSCLGDVMERMSYFEDSLILERCEGFSLTSLSPSSCRLFARRTRSFLSKRKSCSVAQQPHPCVHWNLHLSLALLTSAASSSCWTPSSQRIQRASAGPLRVSLHTQSAAMPSAATPSSLL